MEHLWTLMSVLVGAFLGYFSAWLAQRSNRRRNTYDETIRFLAEYRVQATNSTRSVNTPSQLLSQAAWLDRKIADDFSREAIEAWRAVYHCISAGWFPFEHTYNFDEARDKALNGMHTDLNRWWRLIHQMTFHKG